MNLLLSPPSARHELTIREARSLDELEHLRSDWNDLWSRCRETTPFQSPAWLIAWSKHLARGELLVLSFARKEKLVGIAPFHILVDRTETKQVLLLGTGISDYLDIITAPGYEPHVVSALFDYLDSNRDFWDLCDFQQLRSSSWLLSGTVPDCVSDVQAQESCPMLELAVARGRIKHAIPAKMVSRLSYYRRKLTKIPSAKIETVSRASFDQVFNAFIELHQAQWHAAGQPGVLGDVSVQNFHREAAFGLLESGVLRLHRISIDGRTVAALYGFSHGRRAYYYLSGFDPNYASLSPGVLLIGHAIDQAIRAGATHFDFLRGTEPYKFHWGAKPQSTWRRLLRK